MFNPKRLAAALLVTSVSFAAPAVPRKVVLRGTLSVVQEDDFQHQRTARLHSLIDDATGERFTLHLRAPDARLKTGDRIVVRGMALDRDVELDPDSGALQVVAMADAPAMDARRVVVIVANFSDSPVSCTDASIAGLMWTGAKSVDGLYQAASFGQVSVPNDVDNDGSPDVVRVTIPNLSTEACDPYTWASNAEAAAQAAGVNLGLYQHNVIVLPSNVTCGWAGLGNVGCSSGACRAWIKTCDLQDVYAHEIGHNLNMAHASTDTNNDGTIDCEYCDMSDIMGYGGVGWRLFSSPHEGQKSWIPASNIQTVSSAGTATYVISPLQANPATVPFPQILRVQVPVTGDYYYISYRQAQGYDATLSTNYTDRTNIHRYIGSGYANTTFIAALQDTQFIDDPQNGFSIRQLAHDANSVTVQITTTCIHVAPTVSMSPARQSGKPGQELAFTFWVKNNDPVNCAMQNFPVSAVVPAGFTFTQSAAGIDASPGVTSGVVLRVTSPVSAPDGDNSLSASTAGASASAVYAVDNAAPTSVTLTGSTSKRGMVSLTWTASTYPGGISAYRVMKNGVQIASVTTRSFSEKQPTVAGTYDYTVVAVGGNGSTSIPSNAFRFTVAPPSGGSGGGGKPPRK
jgi:hypothetical protein